MRKILSALAALAMLAHAESVAGLRWAPPASWKTQAARPMRAATYLVPSAAGDKEPGECVAYYFGAGQGGNVEMNILRWKGQVLGADGKVSTAAKTGEKTIHGIKVTTIDASGAYTGMGGPRANEKTVKPNYRLLGAVAEAPAGLVFFKFAGPAKTVQSNESAFWRMIDSLQRQ